MILGSGCLGPRALDGEAIASALARTGLQRVLLVARPEAQPSGLSGLPSSGVRVAWDGRLRGRDLASTARARRLVLDPGPTLELEPACRDLHALSRASAGLGLCVSTPAGGPLAEPATLRLLFEDLAALQPGYWHRPSQVHRLGQEDTDWLQPLAHWLVGMSLDDVTETEDGLPPGLGRLDFRAAADWKARALDVAIDVDPLPDPHLLRFAVDQLRTLGFS